MTDTEVPGAKQSKHDSYAEVGNAFMIATLATCGNDALIWSAIASPLAIQWLSASTVEIALLTKMPNTSV